MLLVLLPVLLRTMRWPPTIRALKLDRLRLRMRVRMGAVRALRLRRADGARRELLDGLAARAEQQAASAGASKEAEPRV